jgi:multidrug efflux pump subunit AcrA (membrane-fusion protein)
MKEIGSGEEQLRAEIESLRRQLDEQKRRASGEHPVHTKGPSRATFVLVVLCLAALLAGGYFWGYLPRQKREQVLAAEARTDAVTLPVVNVEKVERSSGQSNLVLPGNIQAVSEAPVMARATGYLRKRNVDIGDRVAAGQVLAEIEAPELQQQIRQAQAALDQANSTIQQAQAAVQQGSANANMSRVTAERWRNLLAKGVVSRQESDVYQAQYEAQQANVQALEKSVQAARSSAAAAEANLARLNQILTYQTVKAPFAGVITVRNVDAGALVNEGNTLLFRIAQTDRLRTYVNVPQSDAASVRTGLVATVTIADRPGQKFVGRVTRTSNALDPSARTLLTEVELSNPGGLLMPGMYAQVDLSVPRRDPPLLIPGDTLVIRSDGTQVAVVSPEGVVHYSKIQVGRDFGATIEALSGVREGQMVAVNPGDAIREGAKVKPVLAEAKKKP